VANGGTGTATAFTAGSVVFAGASGVYSQDNTNLFWDNSNDRLGIGTATPSYALDVTGQSRVFGTPLATSFALTQILAQYTGSSGPLGLGQRSDGSGHLVNVANAPLRLGTNNIAQMSITAAGDVGIGTASPAYKLDVSGQTRVFGTASSFSQLQMLAQYTGSSGPLGLGQGSDGTGFLVNIANAALAFGTNNTEQMRITAAGNVGIGTSTPENLTGYVSLALNNTTGSFADFRENAVNRLRVGGDNGSGFVNGVSGTLRLLTSDIERIRIDNNGLVGIGTSTPLSRLNVSFSPPATVPALGSGVGALALGPAASYGMLLGTLSDGSGYIQQQRFDSATTVYPIILQPNGGNVGIGSSSSGARLEVTRTDAANGIRVTVGQGAYSGNVALFGVTGQSNGYYITKDAVNNIQHIWDGTGGVERMRIASGGNVGIGTSTPAVSLEVSSAFDEIVRVTGAGSPYASWYTGTTRRGYIQAQAGSFTVASDVGLPLLLSTNTTEKMRITSAGDVGINTSSPSPGLDVNFVAIWCGTKAANPGNGGNIRLRDDTGTFRYAAGILGTSGATSYSIYDNIAATERLTITSAGNVGFGTTNPTARVQISATTSSFGATEVNLALTGANGVTNSSLLFASENTNVRYQNLFNVSTGALSWQNSTNGSTYTERMRIDSSGNVGIGTTSPSSKLTVLDGDIEIGASGAGNTLLSFNGIIANVTVNSSSAPLAFGTNSTERMRINSNGNTGIGTSNPLARFVVSNGSNENIELTSGSVSLNGGVIEYINRGAFPTTRPDLNYYIGVPGAHKFYTDTFERMRIASTGYVGIGTVSPSYPLEVRQDGASSSTYVGAVNTTATGGSGVAGYLARAGSNFAYFYVRGDGTAYIDNATANPLGFATNGTERARIDSSGNLLVGTTSLISAAKVSIDSGAGPSIGSKINTTSAAGHIIFQNPNGVVGQIFTSGSATVYDTASDARLKHDIVDAPEASSLVDALKVRSFKWNVDNSEQRYGFIAQELVEVAPEAVSQPADPEATMGVDYSKLVPMLVKEIQSLRARVAQLEERK
jgi:hypothetical protein